MWKLLVPGETVEVDGGSGFLPYTVGGLAEGRIGLVPEAATVSHAESVPSYPSLVGGGDVELRRGDQVRHAKVLGMEAGMTMLGPTRMRDSQDGSDCPYCWYQDVAGEPTGLGFGFSAGPTIPEAIPITRHECPGCGMTWSSLEWSDLVRKTL